ncbi:MAG: rhomboid family intramembrane serine protease [Chlorobi bacterium]|nr:rhomboid family intramembrane serine protease [Chlorobiota bacterium]
MITYFIIAVSVVTSLVAFNRPDIFDKFKFNAYAINKHKEWYRFFTYGIIHADYMHLFINMFVLYSFGEIVETLFGLNFGQQATLFYILLYVGGIVFSSLWDFGKHKNDSYYNAVGASGAVSAILFSSIILYPQGRIFLFFIPIGIPAPLFGLLYLAYSAYMAKKGTDNVGHSAHFWGAIYGIAFTIALKPSLVITFFENLF